MPASLHRAGIRRRGPVSRPTITDIAEAAGVSLATVDRVLNARPGVRRVTVERVNAAIARLGYVRDLNAANLARKRDYRVVFFLPAGSGQFLTGLRRTVEDTLPVARAERTDVIITAFAPHDPHRLARALDALDCREVDGIAIMAPETPHLRDAIARLKAGGVSVVALVSDLPNSARDHFVGINSIAAGRTAASLMGRFICARPGRIAVFAASMQSRDSIERRLGFDQVIGESFAGLEVLPTIEGHDEPAAIERGFRALLAGTPDIAGIYNMGTGNRALIRLLAENRLAGRVAMIAHELTDSTRAGLVEGVIDAVITQDLGHIVRSALRILRATADARAVLPAQERIRIEVILRENLG